jgi:hypothetical protein
MPAPRTQEQQFVRFVQVDPYRIYQNTACLVWTGSLYKSGYGKLSTGHRGQCYAHRYAWSRVQGPIPDGLVLDHLCRNRRCCNVAHLELVTNAENIRRGRNLQSKKDYCKRGHPLHGDNVRVEKTGRRTCRTCERLRQQKGG